MIFPEHRALFLHVPRTGGTSVELMFAGDLPDVTIPDRKRLWGWDPEGARYLQHVSCAGALEILGRERFDALYKFAVVRDPFARLLSTYRYLAHRYDAKFGDFRGYVRALPELLETPANRSGGHQTPQHAFTHLDGVQVVEEVLRFEELPRCMDRVRARLGVRAALPHVNGIPNPRVQPNAAYDDETIEIVLRVYAEDFERFGYAPWPSTRALEPESVASASAARI